MNGDGGRYNRLDTRPFTCTSTHIHTHEQTHTYIGEEYTTNTHNTSLLHENQPTSQPTTKQAIDRSICQRQQHVICPRLSWMDSGRIDDQRWAGIERTWQGRHGTAQDDRLSACLHARDRGRGGGHKTGLTAAATAAVSYVCTVPLVYGWRLQMKLVICWPAPCTLRTMGSLLILLGWRDGRWTDKPDKMLWQLNATHAARQRISYILGVLLMVGGASIGARMIAGVWNAFYRHALAGCCCCCWFCGRTGGVNGMDGRAV